MNRREAIAALTALPAVTRISKAEVKPNDVIVVELGDKLVAEETAKRIKDILQQVWPGHQIVLLSDGMTLKVVSGS